MSRHFQRSSFRTPLVIGLLALSFATTAITYTLAAFTISFRTHTNDNTGKVGILTYFDSGDGSPSTPFIITRPRHFYNLSLLQNLGAFGTGSYHFQIGKKIGDQNLVYTGDSGTTTTRILNMDGYRFDGEEGKNFYSIGSHSYPFRSTLDGGGIVIQNLHVTSHPDDVGVFGYVSYEGSVTDIIFENTTISSLGYAQQFSEVYVPTASYDDKCYYHVPQSETTKEVTTTDQSDDADDRSALKDVDITTLNASTFGTFTLNYPSNNPQYNSESIGTTYSVSSSTPFLSVTNGEGSATITVNASLLASVDSTNDYSTFWAKESNVFVTRLYVQANNYYESIPVSRVISSYQIYLTNKTNNATENHHDISLGFIHDAYSAEGSDTLTQYHHNNNVGCVIGHLDGSATKIYSYHSTLSLNADSSTHTKASFESLYGMVGETGEHVSGNLNPNKTIKGDVGYIYFDELYERIRSDGAYDATTNPNGYRANYYYPKASADTAGELATEGSLYQHLYKNTSYKLPDDSTKYAAWVSSSSSYLNTATFYQMDIIRGRSDDKKTSYDNSLGIFDLVTEWNGKFNKTNNGSDDVSKYNNSIFDWGEAKNIRTSSSFQKVLYVTNEVRDTTQHTDVNYYPYDHKAGNEYRGDPSPAWPRNFGQADEKPTGDSDSYNASSKQSRAFLYEINLDRDSSTVERYFHKTKYTYLIADLQNTLVNMQGAPLRSSDSLFGITFRKTVASSSVRNESDISSFSKYWRVIGRRRLEFCDDTFSQRVSWNDVKNCVVEGNDGYGAKEYTAGKKYFAYGQLEFTLSRTCNVTVAYPYIAQAAFSGGKSPYLTISRVDLSIKNSYGGTRYPYAACPIPNTAEMANLYYYPEKVGTDIAPADTAPLKWDSATMGNPIFAHTFKLEAGSYFASINAPGYNMPIFYMAVEGQTGGRLGNENTFALASDSLEDVDFLMLCPSTSNDVLAADDQRKSWLALHRTWCVSEIYFNAAPETLVYTTVDLTVEGETRSCFAITFGNSGGLGSIVLSNFGASKASAGFTKVYVVFEQNSATRYIDPTSDDLVAWTYQA